VHVFTVIDVVLVAIASTREILRREGAAVPGIPGWAAVGQRRISILVDYLTN
jgi:hypothetical protein